MLTVASYNIHSCIGTNSAYPCERVFDVLKELDADIIALQEVNIDAGENVLSEFVRHFPGYRFYEGPTLTYEKGRFGNAILTRLRPDSIELMDISVSGREPRGAIIMKFTIGDCEINIVATHLGLLPSERRWQTYKLLRKFNSNGHTDTSINILMGDLNEWFLWGRPLRWLKARFGRCPAVRTFPSRLPLFALDRIWINPVNRLEWLKRHNSRNAKTASDHLPLVAKINT